jgi:hypothetical protein
MAEEEDIALRDLQSIFLKISQVKDSELDNPSDDEAEESMDWYEQFAIQAYEQITQSSHLEGKTKEQILRNSIPDYGSQKRRAGMLYTFVYQAESDRLSYWDKFPLVLTMLDNLDSTESFLGMNLHYIEPRFRRMLMLNLMTKLAGSTRDQESRILGLNNRRLMTPLNKYGRVCIRRYKYDNIRGRALRIPPEHWLKMIFLPTYKFIGGKPSRVWRDSFKKIRQLGMGNP